MLCMHDVQDTPCRRLSVGLKCLRPEPSFRVKSALKQPTANSLRATCTEDYNITTDKLSTPQTRWLLRARRARVLRCKRCSVLHATRSQPPTGPPSPRLQSHQPQPRTAAFLRTAWLSARFRIPNPPLHPPLSHCILRAGSERCSCARRFGACGRGLPATHRPRTKPRPPPPGHLRWKKRS